ncbi:MAG: dUTP diphosphatase [bacterium]
MQLKIKKLNPDATLPSYAHPGDAGMDLFSVEAVMIKPNERISVKTGIALDLDPGFAALCWDKSGLSRKHGLKTLGGVIDAGYRGEVSISLINLSSEEYYIEKGHKIANMIIQRVEQCVIEEVEELSDTSRGEGAFGSTGK